MNRRVPVQFAAVIAVLAITLGAPSRATVLISQDEALAIAFPGLVPVRLTAYLDDEQLQSARRSAGPGIDFPSSVIPYYVATQDGTAQGIAYFDTHIVRNKAETIMVVVNPAGKILRIEVIAFDEPPEYRPRTAWLRQFDQRALTDSLALKQARSKSGMVGHIS